MSSPLASLQPSILWKHFDALRRIPRPSGHEEAVMAHLRSWAEARGLKHRSDAVGNLVIYVPGTKGREKAPTVILQGHVDMVAEKDKSTDFDFLKDPIEVVVEGDWVIAPKTTLGADNGIGVVAAQAVADDAAVAHGPLEVLLYRGRGDRLDGGDEPRREPALRAGHVEPRFRGRRDAVRRLCRRLHDRSGLRPVAQRHSAGLDRAGDQRHRTEGRPFGNRHSREPRQRDQDPRRGARAHARSRSGAAGPHRGGNKHNAIPREASAAIAVPAGSAAVVEELAAAVARDTLQEIGGIDPDLRIEVRPVEGATPAPPRPRPRGWCGCCRPCRTARWS